MIKIAAKKISEAYEHTIKAFDALHSAAANETDAGYRSDILDVRKEIESVLASIRQIESSSEKSVRV